MSGGRLFSFTSKSSRKSSHGQKRARKNATEEERLGLVKGDSPHRREEYRPVQQSSQSMLSLDDEKVGHEQPYQRARRSSSSSSSVSSSPEPQPTYHPPRRDRLLYRGDDATSADIGTYQGTPSHRPSRSPTTKSIIIRGAPPVPPLPGLPRPLPTLPVMTESDIHSLDARTAGRPTIRIPPPSPYLSLSPSPSSPSSPQPPPQQSVSDGAREEPEQGKKPEPESESAKDGSGSRDKRAFI